MKTLMDASRKSVQTTASRWSRDPERASRQAISEMNLRQGWKRWEETPWVKDVVKRYPEAKQLAHSASPYNNNGAYVSEAEHLFYSAPAEDRPILRDYFLGKLGLEQLSCDMNGAGAANCDKRRAFRDIYQIATEACAPSRREGIYL